jgi:hypothetical protein
MKEYNSNIAACGKSTGGRQTREQLSSILGKETPHTTLFQLG